MPHDSQTLSGHLRQILFSPKGSLEGFLGIGAALSQSIAGGIVQAFGYRAGFLLLSAVALAALAILYFFMPEPQERQHRQDNRAIGGEPSHA